MITHTLQLHGPDADSIRAAMIESLEREGYTVTLRPAAWETPTQLADRLRLDPGSVSRSLARSDRPAATAERRGTTGRLVHLVSNASLDAWLTRHKRERVQAPSLPSAAIEPAVLAKYRAALDAIYNHNAASRAAVVLYFGLHHLPLPADACAYAANNGKGDAALPCPR